MARYDETQEDFEEDECYDRPSKSQIKRELQALQDLGKEMTKLGAEALKDSPQISDEQKRALNVYYEPHVNDKYIMASIQADLQNQGRFQESLAEELLQHRAAMKEQNLQSVQMRLAQLSGRVQMPSQEQKKPVNVQNRTFDMNRYMMLKQKQEQLGA